MKLVVSILFSLAVSYMGGCSGHYYQREEVVQKATRPTVDVKVEQHNTVPKISLNSTFSYGPKGASEVDSPPVDEVNNQDLSSLAISLFCGAAGSQIFAELIFVKELKKDKIPLSSLSGIGLGAILASYLAKGEPLAKIEWRFYQFFKSTTDIPLYSAEWIGQVKKYLLFAFRKDRIEQLSKNLVLPIFDNNSHSVRYLNQGSLYDILLANLDLAHYREHKFSSAIGKPISLIFFKAHLAADYVIALFPLQEEILNFKQPSGFLVGNFERELSLRKRNVEEVDLYVSFPIAQKMWIDSVVYMEKYLLNVKKNSEMIILQLRHSLNNLVKKESQL